jgi:hypothetical protein
MSTSDPREAPGTTDLRDEPAVVQPDVEENYAAMWRASVIGGGAAFVYGMSARFLAAGPLLSVMSVAFFVFVPVVVGMLTVWWHPRPTGRFTTFGPWVPMLAIVGTLLLTGWEGAICAAMATPVLLLFASVGGAFGSALPRRGRSASLSAVLLFPYLLSPLESRIPEPERRVETVTTMDIDAPPVAVWPLVASVDSIRPEELRPALFLAMGFPRPIAATLSHEGVGGVRVATFEGGLRFTETVTVWEPARRLRFTIRANGDSLPATTLDEHVRMGGRHFDVLVGEYQLVPLDGGRRTRLVLRSEHRLDTHFNPYAAWWTDRIMRSIQLNIQQVHKQRAERYVTPGAR